VKEDFIPENADRWIFFLAPYIAVVAAFIVMAVVPFGTGLGRNYRRQHRDIVRARRVQRRRAGVDSRGWSSNSKYALLGALRSSAQMVSYEVSMGLAIIGAVDVRAHAFALGHRRCAAI